MLKVLIIQNNPQFSKIKENQNHIIKQIETQDTKEIDIIVLPEMCLTGYDFENQQILQESSEEQLKGQTFLFFQKLSIKYKCYVIGGYPEKCNNNIYYNSSYFLNREGELIQNYRKTHLYITDEKFYQSGCGYQCIEIETLSKQKLKVFPFICMDLNFDTVQEFALKEKPDLLLFLANWIESNPNQKCDDDAQLYILNYWLYRIENYLYKVNSLRYMITCNRVGWEGKTKFIGTSNILKLDQQIQLVQKASRHKEDVLLAELKYE